ncbi:MAG: ATP-grasp domain-containing protein [Pseudomonadota bacterium]
MKRAVLLTLGRLPKGLELARCFHSAGCEVYVADPFSLHLSKPSRAVKETFKVTAPNVDRDQFGADILKIVDDRNIDIVAPVSEEALYVAALAPRLPAGTTLLTAPLERLVRVHDKFSFIETVREAGLRAPTTERASSDAAGRLLEQSDAVVKPVLGCSGAGLTFLSRGATIPETVRGEDFIVQKRVRGREISSLSFVRNGVLQAHVLYRGRVFAGTTAACFERVDDAPDADAWIKTFVAHHDWSGFVAFDFIVDEDGAAWPLECNPRLTSGVHFFDHEDLATLLLDVTSVRQCRMKSQTRFQEGHTCLTKAYAHILQPRAYFDRLKLLFSTQDVLWAPGDRAPFVLMTPMSWPILSQVMFKGASFGEAATRDIEWRPDQAAPSAISTATASTEREMTPSPDARIRSHETAA